MDSEDQLDNNLAYEQLVEALGGKSQASIPFYYNGEKHLLSDFVTGSHIPEQDLFDDDPAWLETLKTPEARAIAVADYLSMQNDRHAGNFLMTPDGVPVAIDNDNSVFGHQFRHLLPVRGRHLRRQPRRSPACPRLRPSVVQQRRTTGQVGLGQRPFPRLR